MTMKNCLALLTSLYCPGCRSLPGWEENPITSSTLLKPGSCIQQAQLGLPFTTLVSVFSIFISGIVSLSTLSLKVNETVSVQDMSSSSAIWLGLPHLGHCRQSLVSSVTISIPYLGDRYIHQQSGLRNTDGLLANRRASSPQTGYYPAHRRATSF